MNKFLSKLVSRYHSVMEWIPERVSEVDFSLDIFTSNNTNVLIRELPSLNEKNKLVLEILLLSVVSGYVFLTSAIVPGNSGRLFLTLATVQGSFLAIVVSVFILSQQVTAVEYSPVALREMREDPAIDYLIGLFVLSILLNLVYYMEITPDLLVIQTNLNIEEGLAVGLAVLCLLLLIPTRRHVIELIGPEEVLDSTIAGIETDSFPKEKNRGLDSPPERNPLLAIDQVLQSAERRSDEFTIRRAIYDMHRATIQGIDGQQDLEDDIDERGFFEYWDPCIDIALDGPRRRGEIAARGLRKVCEKLVEEEMTEYLPGRIDSLDRLFQGMLREGSLTLDLYDEYAILNHKATSEEEPVMRHEISESLLSQINLLQDLASKEGKGVSCETAARFADRILFLSLQSVIVEANVGNTGGDVYELMGRQASMHQSLTGRKDQESNLLNRVNLGEVADRFAVIASACQQNSRRDAAFEAFLLMVETSLHNEDNIDDIKSRLEAANLEGSARKSLIKELLVDSKRKSLSPENEVFDIDEEDYRDTCRALIEDGAQPYPEMGY